MKAAIFVLAMIAVTGCIPVEKLGDCSASDLQYLLGQDDTVLQTMRFSGPVRILTFGQPMTMDHNPGRLNIQSDQTGLIARIWCG